MTDATPPVDSIAPAFDKRVLSARSRFVHDRISLSTTGAFDAVQHAADVAVEESVDQRAVVERKIEGMTFQSRLDELATGTFEDEPEARAFLA